MCMSCVFLCWRSISMLVLANSACTLWRIQYQYVIYFICRCGNHLLSSHGWCRKSLNDKIDYTNQWCCDDSDTPSLMLKFCIESTLCTYDPMMVTSCSRCIKDGCNIISICQFNYRIWIEGMGSELLMYVLYLDDGSRSRGENVTLMERWNVNDVMVGGT